MIGFILGFLTSAAYLGCRYVSSETARSAAKTHCEQTNTNFQRQLDLTHLSYGNTEADKEEFLRILGRDNFPFKTASLSEREYAVWQIAQKEGWEFTRTTLSPYGLPSGCTAYDPSKDESLNKLIRRI